MEELQKRILIDIIKGAVIALAVIFVIAKIKGEI
jgi:hypothetical protein